MKHIIALALLIALAAPAAANPVLANVVYIDVGDGSNCYCPDPSEAFTITVYISDLEPGLQGIFGIAFMFDRTFSGFKLAQTNLLGGLDFGDVEVDGWALTSGGDCVEPDANGLIAVAELTYLYLGTPGLITFMPHPIDGQSFADCNNDLGEWWVRDQPDGNAGICMEPPGGCGTVPVEDASWGSIKALFR